VSDSVVWASAAQQAQDGLVGMRPAWVQASPAAAPHVVPARPARPAPDGWAKAPPVPVAGDRVAREADFRGPAALAAATRRFPAERVCVPAGERHWAAAPRTHGGANRLAQAAADRVRGEAHLAGLSRPCPVVCSPNSTPASALEPMRRLPMENATLRASGRYMPAPVVILQIFRSRPNVEVDLNSPPRQHKSQYGETWDCGRRRPIRPQRGGTSARRWFHQTRTSSIAPCRFHACAPDAARGRSQSRPTDCRG
jgi:hypothetical protein